MPIVQLLSASPLLPAILPAIAVPGLLLLFPLDCACTDVARGGGGRLIRGRFVGEGELVREGRASAPRRRGRCRQGGVWVLAIKAGSRSCHQGVCHQGSCGFLKQVKGASNSLRVHIVAGRAVTELVVLGLSVVSRVAVRCRRRVGLIAGGVAEVSRGHTAQSVTKLVRFSEL